MTSVLASAVNFNKPVRVRQFQQRSMTSSLASAAKFHTLADQLTQPELTSFFSSFIATQKTLLLSALFDTLKQDRNAQACLHALKLVSAISEIIEKRDEKENVAHNEHDEKKNNAHNEHQQQSFRPVSFMRKEYALRPIDFHIGQDVDGRAEQPEGTPEPQFPYEQAQMAQMAQMVLPRQPQIGGRTCFPMSEGQAQMGRMEEKDGRTFKGMVTAGDGQDRERYDNEAVSEWLTDEVGLAVYSRNFWENGYGSLDIIRSIEDKNDLVDIGIADPKHQTHIMEHIRELNAPSLRRCRIGSRTRLRR